MAIHNTDIPVNQVEMTTVKLLKWSFKSNHQELLVQYFFQQQSSITEILIGTRSLEYNTPYSHGAEMLLHINEKFTMGKLKSTLSRISLFKV